VGGRRASMDRRRLAVDVEQLRRKKSSSSSTGRGRSGWYAKRASGGGRADRDGVGDARCKRPAHVQQGRAVQDRTGQDREWQTRLPTGQDRTYLTVGMQLQSERTRPMASVGPPPPGSHQQ
jgi:hypothetical protein